MTDSPNLGLPYIAASQSQKEVTHNAALNILDVLVQGRVIDSTTTSPPGSPSDGQAWIVASSATDEWAGHDGEIAIWFSGWIFLTPAEGWRIWDQDLSRFVFYDGTAWGDVPAPELQTPTLGSSWINYGSGFGGVRYSKSGGGLVTIEGLMQSGSDGVIFTLLDGYRPADTLMFCCWSAGGAYRVDVAANGDVTVSGSNSTFSSLAGIQFYAA